MVMPIAYGSHQVRSAYISNIPYMSWIRHMRGRPIFASAVFHVNDPVFSE